MYSVINAVDIIGAFVTVIIYLLRCCSWVAARSVQPAQHSCGEQNHVHSYNHSVHIAHTRGGWTLVLLRLYQRQIFVCWIEIEDWTTAKGGVGVWYMWCAQNLHTHTHTHTHAHTHTHPHPHPHPPPPEYDLSLCLTEECWHGDHHISNRSVVWRGGRE